MEVDSARVFDGQSRSERIVRWSRIACGLFALAAPFLLYSTLTMGFTTSDVLQWLPSKGVERERYSRFSARFRDDLFIILSWPGCDLDDPRLANVAKVLRSLAAENRSSGIRQVVTTREVVDQLTSGPFGISRSAAMRRLTGVLIGRDGTCAVSIQISKEGKTDNDDVLQMVLTAANLAGLTRDDLRIGGSAYEAVFIDEASERSLTHFVIPSCLAALLMAWLSIGNLRLTLVVLLIAVYGQMLGLACLHLANRQLNAILLVLPTLLFMLTVSAAVHLVNYYRDFGGASNPSAAALAVRRGFRPCALATLTTVFGLMSLGTSQLRPVREFGAFSSLGLLGATSVLLLSFPYVVSRFLPASQLRSSGLSLASPRTIERLVQPIITHANRISMLCVAGLAIAAIGISKLETTVRVESMFEEHSELLRNYTWLEEHLGPLVSVEALCIFQPSCELDSLERLELVDQLHTSVANSAQVGGVFSAMTFFPTIPRGNSLRDTARRTIIGRNIDEQQELLIDRGILAVEAGTEYWRVSSRVPAIHSLNYAEQRTNVAAACESVRRVADTTPGFDLIFTGLSPVFHEAQHQMLSDLGKSFLLAFVFILPVMIVSLQSVRRGLLAMLPNIAPVVLVFGTMGWIGEPLDIASILTASVAMGIAVDDTLHFLIWYSRAERDGADQSAAVTEAYSKCASAMLQTTIICGTSMLAFLPSEFLPTRKFALLMTLMLSAAIVGDLVLLPALLVTRLGARRKP